MAERKWLAERFEEQRPRLRAVAYRMLGSLSEAEDAVQDAWLRLSGTADGEVDDLSSALPRRLASWPAGRAAVFRSGMRLPTPT